MTDKEKVRAEIERLRESFKDLSAASPSRDTTLENIAKAALCKQLLSFIDSMQEEPVSENLEEAANEYAKDYLFTPKPQRAPNIHFINGANWQKQKDAETLNQNALFYDARLKGIEIGKAEMKQQLMAKAVDAMARPYDAELWLGSQNDLKGFTDGEEVKVIILKQD